MVRQVWGCSKRPSIFREGSYKVFAAMGLVWRILYHWWEEIHSTRMWRRATLWDYLDIQPRREAIHCELLLPLLPPPPMRSARRRLAILIVLPAIISRVEVKGPKSSCKDCVWNTPPTAPPPPWCHTGSLATVIIYSLFSWKGTGFDFLMTIFW